MKSTNELISEYFEVECSCVKCVDCKCHAIIKLMLLLGLEKLITQDK